MAFPDKVTQNKRDVKILGLIFNALYLVFVIVFIAITSLITNERKSLKKELTNEGKDLETSSAAIGLGWTIAILMIFTIILGLVAFVKSNVSLIRTYCALVAVILVLHMIMFPMALKISDDEQQVRLRYLVLPNFKEYGAGTTKVVNQLQQKQECCGISSYKDYYGTRENLEWKDEVKLIPSSCCGKYDEEKPLKDDMGQCDLSVYSKRPPCGEQLFRQHFPGDFRKRFMNFSAIKFVVIYALCSVISVGALLWYSRIRTEEERQSRFAFLYSNK